MPVPTLSIAVSLSNLFLFYYTFHSGLQHSLFVVLSSLKKMPAQPVPPVEAHRPGGLEPAHPRHEVGVRGLDQQMVMIAHQHQRVDPPARAQARLAQRGQETRAIRVVAKDRLTAVPAIEHMIDGPLEFDACFASHAISRSPFTPALSKQKEQLSQTDPAPPLAL